VYGGLFVGVFVYLMSFSLPTSTDAHTALLRRALSGLFFDVHSLPRGKERTKKTRQGFPPWIPPPPAVLTMNGGGFCFAKVLHLRGIYLTPQMGQLLARIFAIPFCLKFYMTRVRRRRQNFCNCRVRATSVLAFYHQNANAKVEYALLRKI
jgi:hypothetical protein